jgi:tetratricopeptide (TPR) repeat protein
MLGRLLFFLLLLFIVASPSFAADATNVTDLPPAKLETAAAPDAVRAYLELQGQLHAAQLAIERNRQEAESAATRNAEAITLRLQTLEEALITQRARELEAMQSANRLIITIGGACAAVGFLAMLLTAYLQWRAVNRLTEFSVLSQASLTLGRSALPAPGATAHLVSTAVTDQASTRLFGALERLERRIVELEHTAHPPLGERNSTSETPPADGATPDRENRVTVLLAKSESLLSLDKTEEALACYDEILALEPDHSEALVKKGDALERLRKIDDAIGCYDRAIAAGGSLTVAYLHKGGLFNRLERYEEALQCYEQALRTQEKSHAA